MGFEPAAPVAKTRERWALEGYTVTLDTVEGLGEFVEVETTVEAEAAIDAARTEALATLEALGIDQEATIREAYLDDAAG
ncbi:MAG: CYTH domain-containing protein [Natrialbaceae archaeon]|nr:CYTH domain-containing protein [Natrialbaceae archaeon]